MSIPSLSTLPYATLLASQSSLVNSASGPATSSSSIGAELLAALAQSQGANATSSDSLLQELVSLSSTASGQITAAPQTYNAQGLLQQVQSSMLLNDPLLQSDSTDQNGTLSDSLYQSLVSPPQVAATISNTAGTASASTMPATGTGSAEPNMNWAQLLQKDPSLASVLVESQVQQGLISMLG